jgi:rfaE bifunctional protein kinase chain/domain
VTTEEILAQFPKLSALVVGDICLDRWCTYQPSAAEPSRETGIPRIAVTSSECTAGAGGTVANNLADLGCGEVAVLGVVGADGHATELRAALARRRIQSDLLVEAAGLQTFTYTKLLNAGTGEEDLPRVDFINSHEMSEEVEQKLIARLEIAVGDFDVVLISDQAETATAGVVTPRVRDRIAELAAEYPQNIFWVDSRLRAELFRNVIIKPNAREAQEACQRLFGRYDPQALRSTIGPLPMIVTHGDEGAEVFTDAGQTRVTSRPIAKPVDVCGAGDSFSAGAALTLAVTGSAVDAARIGNLVASITIMKKGTGTATPAEVLAADSAG